ncbi:MAG: hypothetical protein N2109_07385 [Fimbriimonadales bacterium]|nr:hypothetical protein [Fimbriimonadales bacterium]
MLRLAWASFRHRFAENSATIGSLAVATGVVAFALGLGGSLHRALLVQAFAGLGRVHSAIVSSRPLTSSLLPENAWPAIVLSGSLQSADAEQPRGIRVTILALDPNATNPLFGEGDGPAEGQCWISARAARQLGVRVGDDVLVGLPRFDAAPSEAWFRRRTPEAALEAVRFTVARLLAEPGVGEFSLKTGSRRLPAVLIPRSEASFAWSGKSDAWNTLLLVREPPDGLTDRLVDQIPDGDLGLRSSLSADRRVGFVHAEGSVSGAGSGLDAWTHSYSLLLAESVRGSGGGLWYASAAAIDLWNLPRGHAAVSSWVARRLDLRPGSLFEATFLRPLADGSFRRVRATLRVHKVYDERTWLGDPGWTPAIPGLTDADRITDWKAPFPFDARLVTTADEAYWKSHRAAPKLILSPQEAASLGLPWKPRSLLVRPRTSEMDPARLQAAKASVRESMRVLSVLPLREQALLSAQGSSDFRLLFVGLSVAVAVASLMLAIHSLSLSIARRRPLLGLALAAGVPRRMLLQAVAAEAGLLAAAGCGIGAALAWFSMPLLGGLVGSWASDVAPGLQLRPSLSVGEAVGSFACLWMLFFSWSLLAARAELLCGGLRLLRGEPFEAAMGEAPRSRIRILGVLALGLLVLSAALSDPVWRSACGFFACLTAFLISPPAHFGPIGGVVQLSTATASMHARHFASSLGTAALAAFLLGTLQSHGDSLAALARATQATGGTEVSVQLAIGLPVSPTTPEGRRRLGFGAEEERLWRQTRWHELGLLDGEEAGCLNAAKPLAPALAGVPESLLGPQGFRLIRGALQPGRALLDADSARWILQLDVQGEVRPAGLDRPLVVSGLLAPSFLAGYAVVGMRTFRELAPEAQRNRWFLLDLPPALAEEAERLLRRHLADFGPDVRSTKELWAELTRVQRRYLEAFLLLSLTAWLLLAAGAALQTLRRIHERRSHVALFRSIGLPRSAVAAWLCCEAALPSLLGALWGAVCAVAATFPGSSWTAAAGAVAAVLVASGASLAAALGSLKRYSVLESLRSG